MLETIKECLPPKGQHMLAIVTEQMMDQLRQRMLDDTGSRRLREKCFSIIKELKAEAEVLTEKNKAYIERAKERQANKLKKLNTVNIDHEDPNLP